MEPAHPHTWFAGSLNDVAVLPASRLIAGKTERHDGDHQDDEEGDDGEDVGPSHLTQPYVVVPHIVTADTTHVYVMPAGRKDHAAQEYQNACTPYFIIRFRCKYEPTSVILVQ